MLCCSAARTAVPWVLAAHCPSRYARLMARPKSTIPRYKRRRSQPLLRRLWKWLIRLTLIFFLGSILWVLAYRFINPPITFTMLGDVFAGRGAMREWMPIGEIDRDMVRAAIAAEAGKFVAARIPIVGSDGLDACIYKGEAVPVNKAPPVVAKKPRPIPGEEFESTKPLPPLENAVSELPPASETAPEPANSSTTNPPP